ncbi:MAG: class I tRNA ligase family protein [Patescibacteria group bacterium]|nr:class I tRNA ligase family protein [Patescibacteria group bacterium]
MIQQWGADAVRYWTAGGQLGKDIVFDEEELRMGQKLVTKLRNAFQFVKMQLQNADMDSLLSTEIERTSTDQWILKRLQETVAKMTDYLDRFEYGLAKIAFEDFFWTDFCDNYLELIKVRLYQPERFENGIQKQQSGQKTLYEVFYTILLLIAPYLPHVTEEIYQEYYRPELEKKESKSQTSSLHLQSYPSADEF